MNSKALAFQLEYPKDQSTEILKSECCIGIYMFAYVDITGIYREYWQCREEYYISPFFDFSIITMESTNLAGKYGESLRKPCRVLIVHRVLY